MQLFDWLTLPHLTKLVNVEELFCTNTHTHTCVFLLKENQEKICRFLLLSKKLHRLRASIFQYLAAHYFFASSDWIKFDFPPSLSFLLSVIAPMSTASSSVPSSSRAGRPGVRHSSEPRKRFLASGSSDEDPYSLTPSGSSGSSGKGRNSENTPRLPPREKEYFGPQNWAKVRVRIVMILVGKLKLGKGNNNNNNNNPMFGILSPIYAFQRTGS